MSPVRLREDKYEEQPIVSDSREHREVSKMSPLPVFTDEVRIERGGSARNLLQLRSLKHSPIAPFLAE